MDSNLFWFYMTRTAVQARTWANFEPVADGKISFLSKSNHKLATELTEVD